MWRLPSQAASLQAPGYDFCDRSCIHWPLMGVLNVLALAPPTPILTVGHDFRALYDAHFHFVWASLRRLGSSESDTADAAQEVFVVVHRRLGEFEGRSQLRTWLFGICMRVVRDRRKRAYRRHEVQGEEIDPPSATNLEEQTERSRAKIVLARILDEMSPVVRTVFVMYELEGLAGEEISEALGCPIGTVRSRLRLGREHFERAVARLRARNGLEGAGGGSHG